MGCCASTNKTSPPQNSLHISNSGNSKSPPPTYPLIEEETVKEVLSETPTLTTVHKNHQNQSQFIRTVDISRKADEKQHQNGTVSKKPFALFGDDELSEVASTLRENASVSTMITEKRENNGEFDGFRRRYPARSRNWSSPGEVKTEKTVGKYPGRRSEPSPSRNRPGPGTGRRRDSSERWPRSRVMRTERVESGSSTRKTERVESGSGKMIRKVDEGEESGDNRWPPTTNGLLENTLVSLECFIFL